jgi:hypothetical protein
MGWALAGCFAAAVIGLLGLTWAGLALLHFPRPARSRSISLHDLIAVLQLVFASVAGAGALVALVTAYRRQRVAEVASVHDRDRALNERFIAITAQLGSDQPTVRLNQGGIIRFPDFQSGMEASFQGYKNFYFLLTSGG